MHKFFYNIFLQIKANKWLSVLFFILFLVGCTFFANRLKFEEDITRIIPKDEKNDAMAKVIAQLKFTDKVAVIIEKEKASIGMLQRAFKIGFNRAARIMDQLCEAGAVGPEEGTKPRKVLMSSEEFEQYLNEKNG